jgi:hypothetical protein
LIILAVLCLIPVIYAINRYVQIITDEKVFDLSSTGLAIRPLKIVTIDDNTEVTLKVAYIGAKKVIIEDLYLKSRLTYLSGHERILAWIKLAVGYFADDVVGLKTVNGRMSRSSTWIIGGPVYNIENKYVRKSVSALLGLVTVWFFVFYLLPAFWPLLWSGPYLRFQQIAADENLKIFRGKAKLTTPFILDPGMEEQMTVQYRPSSMIPTLGSSSQALNAKMIPANEPLETKPYRLPRPSEFTWKTECSLYVRVESNKYRVDLGTGIVQLEL